MSEMTEFSWSVQTSLTHTFENITGRKEQLLIFHIACCCNSLILVV